MTAGARGARPKLKGNAPWSLPNQSPFGILLDADAFHGFAEALAHRPDIKHVWLVTDDEQAFARMRSQLKRRYRIAMLYRDYLRNFIINTDRNV